MKLRTRLLTIFLAVSLIPLLTFSTVSALSFITKSRNDTYEKNEIKLDIVKAEINWLIEKNTNTLYTIASQPSVRNFDVTNVKKILRNATTDNSNVTIILDNIKGDQVVSSSDDELTNVSYSEFFQEAINGNEKYISDVITATSGKTMVVISTPVRDLSDKVVGVLQANIYLSAFSELVTKLSEDGSNVYILSREGKVLAHPNNEYVQNMEDFSGLEFIHAGLEGQTSSLRTKNISGNKVIVSYGLNDMTDWLVVVETPVKTAMQSAYRLINLFIVMLLIAAIAVVVFSHIFSKSLSRPLVELSSVIKTIADGELKDFDIKINSKDEVGQLYHSFKIMAQNLRDLVGNIQTVSTSLAVQSQQLSRATDETNQSLNQVVTTINEMAQGNNDQTVLIQGTTDAISKVIDIVLKSTDKTEVAANKARESLELSIEGQKALERQSEKIEENNRYVISVGESIKALASMTDEIRAIVGVISGIAGQTNLLSLNASIEAARAGEAGRGFAVVAEEIRKLAEQSGNSTKRIEDIVNIINSKIEETVKHMNMVKESMLVMEISADDTRQSFDRIFSSVSELADIVHDVYTAFEEIKSQTQELTDQAMNISAVVEEASASMQEISASSEEQLASMETIAQSTVQLENMAHELLAQVKKFKVQ